MSKVADRPSSSSKCAGRCSTCASLYFTILGITTLLFILCSELRSLRRLENTQDGVKRERLRLGSGVWDKLNEEPLGWRIQNQTRRHGKIRLEPDYIGWHPRKVDYNDFIAVEAIQSGRLELVRHSDFGKTPVLVKIADAHEATIYRLLYDLHITPSFLGHVTQNNEVVGFITEFVHQHEKPRLRAHPSKREACLAALRRMHARGIAHRDAHGENCLLREDGSAALIDFELSAETSSRAEFDRDLWVMHHTISD